VIRAAELARTRRVAASSRLAQRDVAKTFLPSPAGFLQTLRSSSSGAGKKYKTVFAWPTWSSGSDRAELKGKIDELQRLHFTECSCDLQVFAVDRKLSI